MFASSRNRVNQSTSSKSVRDKYIPIGTDNRGWVHTYDTRTESIHIVSPTGDRERKELGSTQSVDDWVNAVDKEWGWEERQYGGGLVDMLVDYLRCGRQQGDEA